MITNLVGLDGRACCCVCGFFVGDFLFVFPAVIDNYRDPVEGEGRRARGREEGTREGGREGWMRGRGTEGGREMGERERGNKDKGKNREGKGGKMKRESERVKEK